MLNETYIDKVLEHLQVKQIAHRFNKGMNAREIASDMNIGETYVNGIVNLFYRQIEAERRFADDIKGQDENRVL